MSQGSPFRSDIEGLRGLAVLIVVAFHCGIAGMPGGFVGVDVFFVLSGYLITGILVSEFRSTSQLNLTRFYARRARRLLPAAALVGIVTLLAGAVILSPNELVDAARAARATFVYLSNMFFVVNSADYFARGVATNPMLHTWSLAVEEQFYLFWPLLIMVGLKHGRSTRVLIAVLSALAIVSFAASVWLTATAPTIAFYGLPTRAWEFGVGGVAVLLPREPRWTARGMWDVVGCLGILIILGSAHFISGSSGFPGWVAAFPVLGTVAALLAGAQDPNAAAGRALAIRPLQIIGTLSYSCDLWHWPFLVFALALFPSLSVAGRVTAALTSLIVASLAHRMVENPLRFHHALVGRPARSLAFGGALMAVSLIAAMLTLRFAGKLASLPAMRAIEASVVDIARMPRGQCVSLGSSAQVRSCRFGADTSDTTIVLFGDSHAIQWFDPLRQLADSHRWTLITMVKSGCPATDVNVSGSGCGAWRSDAIARIRVLRPTAVVMGSATSYVRSTRQGARRAGVSIGEWEAGTRRTLAALASSGLRVIALRDTPEPGFDVPSCVARTIRHTWFPAGACRFPESRGLDVATFEAERSASRGLPAVTWADFTSQLCPGHVCPAVAKGVIMYRDDNHLTGSFARSLAPQLGDAIERAWSDRP